MVEDPKVKQEEKTDQEQVIPDVLVRASAPVWPVNEEVAALCGPRLVIREDK